VPDLIGMGDSDKLLPGDDRRYTFRRHREFLDALLDELGVTRDVTLVVHDWGSALGFDWGRRHPDRVRAIAYMEAIVRPFDGWDHWPAAQRSIFQALRSPAGEEMVLERDLLFEELLPALIQRTLADDEMNEYRRPFRAPGEDRLPTLVWLRQIPMGGEPADVHELVARYAEWLAATLGIPKLFVNAKPGTIMTGAQRDFCRTWPDQQEITVRGLHFLQEDSGPEIGREIAAWLGSGAVCSPLSFAVAGMPARPGFPEDNRPTALIVTPERGVSSRQLGQGRSDATGAVTAAHEQRVVVSVREVLDGDLRVVSEKLLELRPGG
jgi:haloalkane dehalogenase